MSPSLTHEDRIAVYSADMLKPEPKVLLTLAHNASTVLLVVDESAKHIYYVRNTNTRPGSCGSWPGGVAHNVVRASFESDSEPEVVLEVQKGFCVGTTSAAHDAVGRKIFYSTVDQYVVVIDL
jgi:hypothetical protein